MIGLAAPVHGRVDGEGRLLSADAALAGLHARAGGEPGGLLAVPQLAALVRLARRLAVPISRGVLAADGDDDLDLWVRAERDGDAVMLTIANWTHRPLARPITPSSHAARDFIRAEADWSWSADAALRLVTLSREGLAALSRAGAGGLLGEPLTRLFVLEEAAGGGLPLLEALAGGTAFDRQIVALRGGGARFRLAATPVLDPLGRVRVFEGSAVALPAADAAEPADAAPPADDGAFARRLDAALRAPLNRIVAAAETIREQDEGPLRADYGGYAGDIADAGRHLLGLVEDLIDLEATERDAPTITPEPLDMADLARRAAGLLSVRADDRRMRIERPGEGDVLPGVGDFRRALQVMVNLISNAVRFGPAGSAVHVIVEPRGDSVAAIVVDAGRGVAPADRERVFEKFERLGAAEPGSGLGLYISRRLARAMGGDIVIEDAPGAGACFVFTLPAGAQDPPA